MNYSFKFNEFKLNLKNLEKILDTQTLVADNQFLKILEILDIQNFNFLNVDKEIPFYVDHLIDTADFLQSKVKYFKMSDIIKYSISREDIPGSRANAIKKNISKGFCFNQYFKNQNKIEIIGNNIKHTQKNEDFNYFLLPEEYPGFLKQFCPNIFNVILGAKILTSSFFLDEFISVFGYCFEYPMNFNRFFQNFQEFKNFAQAIGYADFFSTLDLQGSYKDAVYYLKNKLLIKNFEPIPYSMFKYENAFCLNSYVFSNQSSQNAENYYMEEINMKRKEQSIRVVTLPGDKSELYQNTYDFYMQQILQFKRKSINSLIIKNLYDNIINNYPINSALISNVDSTQKFINYLKSGIEIVGEKLFHKHYQIFIANGNYEISRIKTYARSKGLNKIFVANFKTFQIEEFLLKKSKKRDFVVVSY